MKCRYETSNGRCGLKECYAYRHKCYGEDMCKCIEPMTNGDRIRAMSDEGLAEFNSFCPFIDEDCTRKGCIACILEWLKQPAEE